LLRSAKDTEHSDFLRKLGLFVEPEFLDAATCARLVAEIRSAAADKGIVVGRKEERESGGAVDESGRKVWHAQIHSATETEISRRLESVRPRLERHFGVRLTDCEGPHFLRYDAGGFHVPHRDARPGSPLDIKRRKVSLVVFLNSSVPEPVAGTKNRKRKDVETAYGYGGGELVLYGLVDDPKWQNFGFSVPANTGLLVAYPSYQAHEIKPVKFGQRFTIVAWFRGDAAW
jgi:predicted 2-oxoglutarate/Fe(II)-dependent dioxygenase YbiX